MIYLILILFFFTSILFFMSIFQSLFLKERRLKKRMKHYLALTDEKVSQNQINFSGQFQLAKKRIRAKFLTKEKNTKLEITLARSGLPVKPEEYILFQWILAAFSGCLLMLITGKLLFLIIGGILGFLFPKWFVRRKERDRVMKFNEALPI